ncbi:M1 family metallopeptidase [Paenibacillus polymyxa]|uniref:M1 family metallopeptidase n=1 Tax=Paenibacillus polymyxa TaxID=1406 RepID=UPI0020256659|nr:M1 family metallopeptidase [Paenibacillus polymyxa]URJ60516.1 M1 family metallopeptidase [Paenibacillus polymyxa]
MTPARTKIVLLSTLALGLLAGTLWFAWQPQSQSDPQSIGQPLYGSLSESALAPNMGKPLGANILPDLPKNPPQPATEILSKRVVEYHIDVSLEKGQVLRGTETLTWKHPGKKTVNDLYLHLYPNAFSSMETTFMKESGGKLRGDTMPKDGFGSMTLTELKTEDGLSLMHRIQYVQPDDGNAGDRSLMKVRLPKPVRGGEEITLYMKFEVKLPAIFARMGGTDDFVMAGQWFPKLSVYETAGQRGRAEEGWNLHQYHGNSEFYADFGIYSVRIRVPETHIVAATGFPTRGAVRQNGQKIYQFYADDVHDFAWSASPNFVTVEEPFSSAEVPGVKIKLYLDPSHKELKGRYISAAKAALSYYSKWYGPYPYSTLSIVVPPKSGNGAGGMEYPTLITAAAAGNLNPGYSLERTLVHEIGHQYFYGMVANNEFEEPWLDEGFTSYAEERLMEQEYGLTPNLPLQSGQVSSPQPLNRESWKYGSAAEYAQNAYSRGKLVLRGIERQVGMKKMDRIMRTYVQTYRFKHPSSQDFQRIVERVTGRSWSHYFEQYVYDGQMADFSVDHITNHKLENGYEAVVTVSKKGADYPKIPVQFTFKDGTTIFKAWDGAGKSTTFRIKSTSPVSNVTLDPLYTIALENKHINNSLKAELDEKQQTRWSISVTKLLETLLGSLSW